MTVHLLIKGKVQGVFYRVSAKKMALEFGLTGWVKNTRAGDVEAMVSGQAEAINMFVDWCKKGPSRAAVAEVIATREEDAVFTGFVIK
jgi:acylphosphatase